MPRASRINPDWIAAQCLLAQLLVVSARLWHHEDLDADDAACSVWTRTTRAYSFWRSSLRSKRGRGDVLSGVGKGITASRQLSPNSPRNSVS